MHQEDRKDTKATKIEELVTVAFAEDMELAKQYEELLRNNEICVQIKRQPEMGQSGFSDIAIMVPEDALDEAHTLISEKANYDDFFDMILEDSEYRQFDCSSLDLDDEETLY
jgi:hypothetical protein